MEKKKFYEKTWFFVVMCIFIPPVAIALMWIQKKGSNVARIVGSVVLGLYTIAIIANMVNPQTTTNNTPQPSNSVSQVQSQEEKDKESLEALKEQNLLDAKNKINELGYTAKIFHARDPENELTDWFEGYSDEELQGWIVTDVKNIDTSAKTVEVYADTAEHIAEEKAAEEREKNLEAKLSAGAAWTAVELYGEQQCPYGFDLHNFVGLIAQEPSDDNTWFLKAEVTVTNAFGAERDTVCEAHVTGTSESPQIVDFLIY